MTSVLKFGKARSKPPSSFALGASPIFKRMLFGGFSESKPARGEWVVQLPDENISGFETIMHIIHFNYQKVTNFTNSDHSFSCEELPNPHPCVCDRPNPMNKLYAVATTADKYDLVHLLQPWAWTWLRRARREPHCDIDCYEHDWHGELIWIAWVFGNEHLLQQQLDRAILSAFVIEKEPDSNYESNAKDGNPSSALKNRHLYLSHNDYYDSAAFPVHRSGDRFNHIFARLGVADQIEERRLELITFLLEPIRSLLHQRLIDMYRLSGTLGEHLDGDYTGPSMPKDDDIPFPKAEDFNSQVLKLHDELNTILLRTVAKGKEFTELKEKSECKWGEIMKKRPFIELSESHKAHLKRQREKVDIPLDEDYDSNGEDMDLD